MSSFSRWFDELKRRRVIRVLLVYVAAAFAALEGASALTEALSLPAWIPTLIAVLGVVGLPVVAALAWAFDWTAVGVERTEGLREDPSSSGSSGPAPAAATGFTRGRLVTLAILLLIVVAAGVAWWLRGPPPVPLSTDVVAVVPFRVPGPEVQYLREGMVDLLAAKLTGEGGLRAVEPRTVLAAWSRSGHEQDEELRARSVAAQTGAARVLLGSVVPAGDRLLVTGRLEETSSGRVLARAEQSLAADSLPLLVDRFAAQLLGQMSGADAGRLPLLARTPLPALRAYLEGQQALRDGRFEQAAQAFDRALARDSTFALAGLHRRIAASFTDIPTGPGLRVAWEHREGLAPRDRAYVEAVAGPRYPGWTPRRERLRGFQRLTREAPDRAEAWYELGDYYFHWTLWLPLDERLREARRAFERALHLDPSFAPARFHMFDLAVQVGDTAAARHHAERFLEGDVTGPTASFARRVLGRFEDPETPVVPVNSAEEDHFLLGVARTHRRSLEAADSLVERTLSAAEAPSPSFGRSMHLYLLDRGRPQQAFQVARDIEGRDPLYVDGFRLVHPLYDELGGPPQDAERIVRDLERAVARRGELVDGELWWQEAACFVGLFAAREGRKDRALALADTLHRAAADPALPDLAVPVLNACESMIRVELAIESLPRDPSATRRHVERLDSLHANALDPWVRDAASLVLARGWESLGDLDRALEATRRRVLSIPHVYFIAAQLREEGRLAARVGRREEAIRAYREFLALRSDPEPAVRPAVDQVRQELADLVGEGQ